MRPEVPVRDEPLRGVAARYRWKVGREQPVRHHRGRRRHRGHTERGEAGDERGLGDPDAAGHRHEAGDEAGPGHDEDELAEGQAGVVRKQRRAEAERVEELGADAAAHHEEQLARGAQDAPHVAEPVPQLRPHLLLREATELGDDEHDADEHRRRDHADEDELGVVT